MKQITKFFKMIDEEGYQKTEDLYELDDVEITVNVFNENECINNRFDTFFEVSERSESKNQWYR